MLANFTRTIDRQPAERSLATNPAQTNRVDDQRLGNGSAAFEVWLSAYRRRLEEAHAKQIPDPGQPRAAGI